MSCSQRGVASRAEDIRVSGTIHGNFQIDVFDVRVSKPKRVRLNVEAPKENTHVLLRLRAERDSPNMPRMHGQQEEREHGLRIEGSPLCQLAAAWQTTDPSRTDTRPTCKQVARGCEEVGRDDAAGGRGTGRAAGPSGA